MKRNGNIVIVSGIDANGREWFNLVHESAAYSVARDMRADGYINVTVTR